MARDGGSGCKCGSYYETAVAENSMNIELVTRSSIQMLSARNYQRTDHYSQF